jgi:hypothetical protein
MSFAKKTEQTHSHENILVNLLLSRDMTAIVSSGAGGELCLNF